MFGSFFKAKRTEETNRFTPRAQQALALALKEAASLNHNFAGTEHLLLGLMALGSGVHFSVLQKLGVNLETARAAVEKQAGKGLEQQMIGSIPYTRQVKKVLRLAAKEAKAMGHIYVGTEHLLLGLLEEKDGIAARVLIHLGVKIEQARIEILKELDPNYPNRAAANETAIHPMNQPQPDANSIDTAKRYDIYCKEGEEKTLVYRNALFKSRKKLMDNRDHDYLSEFIEIEQSNGVSMFISLMTVKKFCPTGTLSTAETEGGGK